MKKYRFEFLLSALVCAAGLAVPAWAQEAQAPAPSPQESLADAARRVRQEKKAEAPGKQVWTNENIPRVPREEAKAVEGGEEAAAAGEGAKGAKPAGGADEAAKSAQAEASWRQKFADARKKLDDDQKDLELMERELGLKRQQYYSDPNTALRDQYQRDSGPGGGGAVNTLVQQIDEKKKQIEADKQALDNLEDELRKAGLPPGWSRP